MPSARILHALESGVMSAVAPLAKEEREAVAAYLGSSVGLQTLTPQAFCRDRKVSIADRAEGGLERMEPQPGQHSLSVRPKQPA